MNLDIHLLLFGSTGLLQRRFKYFTFDCNLLSILVYYKVSQKNLVIVGYLRRARKTQSGVFELCKPTDKDTIVKVFGEPVKTSFISER